MIRDRKLIVPTFVVTVSLLAVLWFGSGGGLMRTPSDPGRLMIDRISPIGTMEVLRDGKTLNVEDDAVRPGERVDIVIPMFIPGDPDRKIDFAALKMRCYQQDATGTFVEVDANRVLTHPQIVYQLGHRMPAITLTVGVWTDLPSQDSYIVLAESRTLDDVGLSHGAFKITSAF